MRALGMVLICAAAAWTPGRPLHGAQVEFYKAASIAFPGLAVPAGVRSTALGGASAALGEDVYSLHSNPAGLAALSGFQLGLCHNEWAAELGLRQDLLAYGQGLGGGRALAGSFSYFGLGQFDQRDANGALQGSGSRALMLSGAVGYAWSLLARRQLKLGVSVEAAQQELFGRTQAELGGSLGFVYLLANGVSWAASLEHGGTGAQGFRPPQSLNAGLALPLLDRAMSLGLDLQLPDASDPLLKAGAEYRLGVLALRAGYRQALGAPAEDVQSGVTAGLGFKLGYLQLDYAYVSYGALSQVHRLGLTLALPGDYFRNSRTVPEGSVEAAKAYYEKAVDLEFSGETLRALIEYQRCQESYPRKLSGTAAPFYLAAQKKVVELQAEMNKRGDGGQLGAVVKDMVKKAQAHLRSERYGEAIRDLQEAAKLDPENRVVASLLEGARRDREGTLVGYRRAGRAADREGRLQAAVESYQKLLGLDPTDEEATDFFREHRKALEALLRQIHRKGIYEYVGGGLEQAIQTWTAGQALDHFGDVGFEQDIAKAKKRLGQRNGT